MAKKMSKKEMQRLGTEKLSGEVSTPNRYYLLVNELNKICHIMIDILNDRETKKLEEVEYINELGFMAQCHMISQLFYLCELARLLTKKEWVKVGKFCKVYQQY